MFLTRAARRATSRFCGRKREGAGDRPAGARRRGKSRRWPKASRDRPQPGDRVMLVSENRPEWLIADLGIMAAGCVTVPTYTTNTTRDHQHILGNSGARR